MSSDPIGARAPADVQNTGKVGMSLPKKAGIALVSLVAFGAIGVGVLTFLATQSVDVRCFNSLNSLTVYGGGAFIAGGLGLPLTLGVLAYATKTRHQTPTVDAISSQPPSTPDAEMTKEEAVKASKKVPANLMFGQVYLGRDMAFAQTCGMKIQRHDENGQNAGLLDTSNPQGFNTIITVCPLQSVAGEYLEFVETSHQDLRNHYEKQDKNWYYIGKIAVDDPSYWEAMVYDCTYLTGDLAEQTLPLDVEGFTACRDAKAEQARRCSVDQWFEPIFRAIDEGERGEKKVLVHCQAGQSRSATIIAAYLIKRRGYTPKQATAFITERRPCAAPKFTEGLAAYAEALQAP